MRSIHLVLLLVVSSLVLPACSGFTQCDTVATISAETARWICNSLTTVQTESKEAATLQDPARKRQLLDRTEALSQFLHDQSLISQRFSVTMAKMGEGEQSAMHKERAEIIDALQRDLQVVVRQLRAPD